MEKQKNIGLIIDLDTDCDACLKGAWQLVDGQPRDLEWETSLGATADEDCAAIFNGTELLLSFSLSAETAVLPEHEPPFPVRYRNAGHEGLSLDGNWLAPGGELDRRPVFLEDAVGSIRILFPAG